MKHVFPKFLEEGKTRFLLLPFHNFSKQTISSSTPSEAPFIK